MIPPALVTAMRTLSIVPVPGRDTSRLQDSLLWFPLVGFLVGWILVGLCLLSGMLTMKPELQALLALIGSVALTRAFHLDGLADCADGFLGGWSKSRRLAIMKDSAIGVFGATALVLLLLGKWLCLWLILGQSLVALLPLAFLASRTAMVPLCCCFQYARREGTGAAFIQKASTRQVGPTLLFALLLSLFFLPLGPIALAIACALALLFGLICRRLLGGVTGDCLGACCEICELAILVLLAR